MSGNWARFEVEALVADHFDMLARELRGEKVNKTAHRRALAALLNNRSDGSIERKHQNVSAILIQANHAYIDGYKPLPNVQGLLREVVLDRLATDHLLASAADSAARANVVIPTVDDLLARLEEPPEPVEKVTYGQSSETRQIHPRIVDYLALESRNRQLGRAGEELTVNFERARLIHAGKESLADRVEHVSVTQGDGLGFDVRSFEVDGKDRFIEVKTTSEGKFFPFHVSANELEVSRELRRSYHLYRWFRFRDDPRLYSLNGSLTDTCTLEARSYAARVK